MATFRWDLSNPPLATLPESTSLMIHTVRIDLNVPYARREEAKALGAYWDNSRKTWYARPGTDLSYFKREWLPSGLARPARADGEPDQNESVGNETENGVSLSELLSRLKGVINDGMPDPVWVRAEISEISSKNGNYYLQLIERNGRGDPLGKAKAILWKNRAEGVIAKFEEATGEGLRTDIKILCLAKVRFDALFGLDLIIEDVDPSYTLGDLAARLARIRQKLTDDRIIDRNQRLPAPVEFTRVAVISPETSAGLGDFRRETDRLQRAGLCDFEYFRATFQGLDAPSSIRTAVNEALASHRSNPFDALVVIRGGGSVTDLAWLNHLELAQAVCLSAIPVLTGIGHERDSTILDEVAHRRFDTPSKVALHITSTIRDNAMAASSALDSLRLQVARILTRERTGITTQADRIRSGARTALRQAQDGRENSLIVLRSTLRYRLSQERAAIQMQGDRLREGAQLVTQQAAEDGEEFIASIRTAARYQLREAVQSVDATYDRLAASADQAVCEVGSALQRSIEGIAHRTQLQLSEQAGSLERAASLIALKSGAAIKAAVGSLDRGLSEIAREAGRQMERAFNALEVEREAMGAKAARSADEARDDVESNIRFIVGLGPQSTLRRGFAIAKASDGIPITSRDAASRAPSLTLEFHDGSLKLINDKIERGEKP